MIAFGSSITSADVYERCAERGIRVAGEPDSVVFANAAAGSLFRSYNLILDMAAAQDELEALVLVHQDAEIVDRDFCDKLRHVLRDSEVGVVGCVGAIDVRSIAWWEGSVTWASFVHRYEEMGGGEITAISFEENGRPAYARTGEVDTVDGFLLALSPWTVRNMRFDESLGQLHGYDFDFCLQARAAGRKVVTEDFKVIHHHSLELVKDLPVWMEAHMRVAEKWDGRMPNVGMPNLGVAEGDWKRRARHAEAEAAATRLEAVSAKMHANARERELERQLEEVTESVSWRMTSALRKLNALRKRRAAPPRDSS